jgi:peroxiredoxin
VDIQDGEDAARKFIADFGLSFPNVRDTRGAVAIDYGVYGVPETYFIDRGGRIRAKHVGAVTAELFRATVEPLAAESSEGASTAPSDTSPRR